MAANKSRLVCRQTNTKRGAAVSPTQRTLAHLRKDGWRVQVVEHWNHFARRRIDLFGVIDLVAVRPGETLGVQATSGANVSARVSKSRESEGLRAWLEAGNTFRVFGWRKLTRGQKRPTWLPQIVDLTLAD
jgi:hypothetical protein